MTKPGQKVASIPEIEQREERKRAEQAKKDWKPKNVVLYLRVSSQRQVQEGFSLDEQFNVLRKFCKEKGCNILEVFREPGKSATDVKNRPEFKKMFEYCMKNAKIIFAVVVFDPDRYFRNAVLHGEYRNRFADVGIKFMSPHCEFADRPDAKEMKNAAENQEFTEKLSKRMKESREATLRDGREAGKAPIGYLQVRDPDRSRGCILMIDPVRAPIIAEAIEAFVYSSRTRQSLYNWALEKGLTSPQTNLPVSKNTFYRIFENPKYGGIQRTTSGEYKTSVHPPIVSEETIRLSIKKALEGNPSRRVAHEKNLDGIPLRNVLCCPKCGKRLSGSKSKGKMGQRFGYYHAPRHESHCAMKKLRLPSKVTNEAFLDVLERLKVDQVVFDLLEVFVRDRQQSSREANGAEVEALTAEIERVRGVLDGLVDKYAAGKISDDEYQRAVSRNEDINAKLEARIEVLKNADLPLDQMVFRAATALEHPDVTWSLLSDDERNRMAHALFPDGIGFTESLKPVLTSNVMHGGLITLESRTAWRKTWWRKKPTTKSLDAKP